MSMAEAVVVERSNRWWALRRGVAIGIGGAGAGVLLWGAWFARERPVQIQHPVNTDVHTWSLVLVGGAVAAVVLRVVAVRRPGPDPDDLPVFGMEQWLVTLCLGLLGVAGWLIWAGASGLHFQASTGYITGTRFAVAMGATAIVVGGLLSIRRPLQRRTGLWAPGGFSAIPGAAIILVPVVIFASAAPSIGVHHRTVTAEPIPAVPALVTHQAWTLRTPGFINGLVAAGPGVVITTDGAMEAVDGRTGRIRWSYRRDRDPVSGLQASPNGRYVAVIESASQAGGHTDSFLRVFDAETGNLVRTATFVGSAPATTGAPPNYRLTDEALVFTEVEHQAVDAAATSLATGRLLWRTPAIPLAYGDPTVSAGSVIANGAILIGGRVSTSGPTALNAVDLATGRVRWQHPSPDRDVLGLESPDGSLVRIDPESGAPTLYDAASGRPIPLPAGSTVANLLDRGRVLLQQGRAFSILDTRTGVRTPTSDSCWQQIPEGFPFGYFTDPQVAPDAELADGPVCIQPGAGGAATVAGAGASGQHLTVGIGGVSAHDLPSVLAAPGAVVVSPNESQTGSSGPDLLVGLQ